MSLPNEIIDDFAPMVKRISAEYANKYRMVAREDVEQELWIWFLKHPNKIKEWSEEDQKDFDRLVARSLRNAAYDYCLSEKAQVEGYDRNDMFFYRKEFIKQLLPAALSSDYRKVEVFASEVKAPKAPAESGDWMAYAADIRKVYAKLDLDDQNLILTYYVEDKDTKTLHELYGGERTSDKATAMAANRALNKMVKLLGGNPPFRDKDYNADTSTDTSASAEGGSDSTS